MADPRSTPGRARGLIVAAPSSGTGKTVATLGLIGALRARGLSVAPAKVGPDYIDPGFHAAAAGRDCINLDAWAMAPGQLVGRLAMHAAGADLVIVEGVMGLFDGAAGGRGSTADVAKASGLPVVLVIDAAGLSQSVAAIAHGFGSFDPGVVIAGVVLTRVASDRHEAMLKAALAARGIACLGAIRRDPGLALASRHLGLVQATEHGDLDAFVARAAALVTAGIDLERVLAAARPVGSRESVRPLAPLGQRIAVACDRAFAFAYPHMLADWRSCGAEVTVFSPLADEAPRPDADAVFLPGGYPELHAARLAAAETFRRGMGGAVARGALVYGECGGYMVLGRALVDADGAAHPMLALLPVTTSFAERRRTLGYRTLVHDGRLPWPRVLAGHEFHYSVEIGHDAGRPALFTATDANGRALGACGAVAGRVLGSYAHVIDAPGS